jgi:hypothetical protein
LLRLVAIVSGAKLVRWNGGINPLDCPAILMRIWKKMAKTRSRNFNGLAAVSK